jgi:hypothetical protein
MVGRHCAVSGETCTRGDVGRSQSLHSTVAVISAKSVESKATPRKGRQEGGCVKSSNRQCISYVSPVSRRGGTKQGTEAGSWVEASIWTEHMLAALENGVKGGKWFSLIDKVTRLRTLEKALDRLMRERGYHMIRYADDFVVMCPSVEVAQSALAEVRAWVAQNGLRLHPDKTHVGDCSVAGQGFEFLGYRFEAGKRWVRRKSLNSLRERIRTRTKRTRGDSIEHIIESLNPMLRGWFGYFKHANPYVFKSVDGFIRRRLRAILRKQQKRPGLGLCHSDHKRWPKAYFAGHGLFTMTEAHATACQSRC